MQLWLANIHIVLYTLFVVITWKYVGFGIILFLAGLQGIPPELKEAVVLDGASPRQSFRHLTLPLLGAHHPDSGLFSLSSGLSSSSTSFGS